MINLKQLNAYIPYCHFNERFAKTEILVAKRRLLLRPRFKRCIFFGSLGKKLKSICSFRFVRKLVRVPLTLVWFGTNTTKLFTKLLKVPMTILRKMNIKMIIYLDGMLLIGHSLDEIIMSRDTVIFLLQHLRFFINWKKSVLTPVQEIEFLGLTINSVTLELSLNKTKIQKVVSECQNLLNNPQTSILELTRLIGLLTSTIQAVLPARLNCRFLQMQQISSLSENLSYLDKIVLNEDSKIELKRWVQNLELCNGRALIQPPAELLIQTDASTKGWGATCNGISTGGMWFVQEMKYHINILVLLAVKLAVQTFSKTLKHKAIHLQVDNMVALTYLLKMGDTKNLKLVQLAKDIWGPSSPMWDHAYCRVPSQQTECDSRLGVKKQFGLLRMEASSPVISENLSTEGNPRDRSICFQIISSDQDSLFVETRSIESSSRYLPTKLVPQESLCFSPILHDPKGFEQSPQRQSTYDDPCNSSLAITIVVPRSNENVHTTTNFIDLKERSIKKSKRRNSSPCPKQNFKISGMDGLRARLQKEGVSREASNLIIKSRRSSSNSNYQSAWGKWAG